MSGSAGGQTGGSTMASRSSGFGMNPYMQGQPPQGYGSQYQGGPQDNRIQGTPYYPTGNQAFDQRRASVYRNQRDQEAQNFMRNFGQRSNPTSTTSQSPLMAPGSQSQQSPTPIIGSSANNGEGGGSESYVENPRQTTGSANNLGELAGLTVMPDEYNDPNYNPNWMSERAAQEALSRQMFPNNRSQAWTPYQQQVYGGGFGGQQMFQRGSPFQQQMGGGGSRK